jgi:protein SCO1/2
MIAGYMMARAVFCARRMRWRLCVAMLIAVIAGCGKNASEVPAPEPASGGGSYAAVNPADCLPAVTLTDQHGGRVALAALKGRPVLIDFIYTGCKTECPLLTSKFAAIARLLGPAVGAKVLLVSITIDPAHDHPGQLLAYAKTHDADLNGWLFLSGSENDIANVLKVYGLRIEREADGSIAHIATAFLLGPDGRQARIYNALEVAAKTVVADIDQVLGRG